MAALKKKKKRLPTEVKVIPSVLQNSHGQLYRLCHAQDTCQGRDESCPHPEGAPAANLHKHLGGYQPPRPRPPRLLLPRCRSTCCSNPGLGPFLVPGSAQAWTQSKGCLPHPGSS